MSSWKSMAFIGFNTRVRKMLPKKRATQTPRTMKKGPVALMTMTMTTINQVAGWQPTRKEEAVNTTETTTMHLIRMIPEAGAMDLGRQPTAAEGPETGAVDLG